MKSPDGEVSRPCQLLACGETDESWETALVMARSCVRDIIWDFSTDPSQRKLSHVQICANVETYIRSLIRVVQQRDRGRSVFRRKFLDQPLAGVEALRRLANAQSPYYVAKAWTALPKVAMDALNEACIDLHGKPLHSVVAEWPNISGSLVQIDADELSRLIPIAIEKARSYGNRNPIRDDAIMVIVREQERLIGKWPSAKAAARFITAIEGCYRELLPAHGFGIDSDSTIFRLLRRARDLT
jgi:hypothetical protein